MIDYFFLQNLSWLTTWIYNLLGPEEGVWFIDLKTGTGSVGKGDAPNSADATLTMHSKDFADMFAGICYKLKLLTGVLIKANF